ncbi:MAG: accessory factor UbiK family protein [Pseudomonadales bacterium]|nr:accessory factor UbiK family protein [Pseudomonadales bacterium]
MSRQENLVNRIMEMISERLPSELGEMSQDLRHNLTALIKESLGKMDVVTREEFDVQEKVLARTRQRLEDMEQQLHALEQKLKEPSEG